MDNPVKSVCYQNCSWRLVAGRAGPVYAKLHSSDNHIAFNQHGINPPGYPSPVRPHGQVDIRPTAMNVENFVPAFIDPWTGTTP